MQETNLKISPYFDDFDSSKNYQKVLFKPGYSVQTRELNTLQSILQNQVEKFGQHIFKDGSIVIPGNVNYNLSAKCVLIQPLMNGVSVESYLSQLVGKTLTGATSGVKAEVNDTLTIEESEKDTITLYVSYNYGGILEDGDQVKEFKNNEVLIDEDGNAVAVTAVQNASTYIGSTVNINAGVYFVRGFFVEVSPQQIILEQYNSTPTYKVGLQISESIVSANEDETLYDNSLGSTNYASPGADRLKIELKLVKQNPLITENSNFIELLRFENGNVIQQADAYVSAYSQLEKNLARRTFDESGSYTTRPYTIKVREALNDGENGGVFFPNEVIYDGRTIVKEIPQGVQLSNIGNNAYTDGTSQYIVGSEYYAIELSEGKAYVEGFEVLNERKQIVVVPKPRKTKTLNNQGVVLNLGSYVNVDSSATIKGTVNFNDTLYLKDADSTIIGIAKAVGLTGDYKLYLSAVTVYEKLTLSSVTGVTAGDLLTGETSGASGFVQSISGSVVTLRQVSGSFVQSEVISSSRYSTATIPTTVTSIERNLLENVRTIEKIIGANVLFSCSVKLDAISLSGSSFVVTGGTSLSGINTAFDFELSEKSKVKLGAQTAVEVDSISSNGSTVTLSSSVTNDTYYTASKLVCKLYSSSNGLTVKSSVNPTSMQSDYIHHRLIVESKTINSSGGFVIQTASDTVIDKDSIIITSGTQEVSATLTQTTSNTVEVTSTGLTAGTNVTVYYGLRISNPTVRTKEKQSFQFLSVDKVKNSTNNNYGTRYVDKEISLKFPDVLKIHAIHQAIKSGESAVNLFDSLILNDASLLEVGDLITLGTVRARIISITGNTVYIIYKSATKFQSGENLAIAVDVPTNPNAVGIYIRESNYGRYIDITDDFKFVRNDDRDYYKVSKLVRKSSASVPQNNFVVVFDYFKHSDLTNDFYSVESYCPDMDSGAMWYGEIPYSFNYQPMADLIDFRYYVQPSAITGTSGTISSPFKETASSFDLYNSTITSNQSVPYPGSVFGLDYEFYLGRVDKVYLAPSSQKYGFTTGVARVIQGSDAVEPVASDDPAAGLLLATIKLPPYLKDISQAEITLEKTRNYTMKDIGKLEERLSNVEKYTSLSLLEVSTNNLNILDEEGRNRFKNGFVVDSFTTTDVADLSNPDYTASIDLDENIVRPYPYVNNTGFFYSDTLSTAVKEDSYVTIPYEETPFVNQSYSSRVENLFPYEVFSWVGNMEITPKKDIWYDTQREIKEGQNINLVDSYTALFDLVVPGGQVWGNWELGAGGTRFGRGGRTITDIMRGTQYDVSTLNFDIESGDTIQDIKDVRYSRSRIINIGTSGLKPNTRFYFYINDVESSDIIYPKLLNVSGTVGTFLLNEQVHLIPNYNDDLVRPQIFSPLVATVINPTILTDSISLSDFNSNGYTTSTTILGIDQIRSIDGSDINPTLIGSRFTIRGVTSGATTNVTEDQILISNESGTLNAFVLLPPQTFETGDLTFSLSDLKDNVQIKGLTNSYATGLYYSQGTELSVTSNLTTLEVPELTATAITQERTRFIPNPPPAPRHDPIAQSFFVDEQGGIFVTSIDLFFLTKDPIAPVTIDIRTVENGNPSANIVPGSVVTVASSDVKLSNDASVPTRFKFKNPLYLSSSNDYAFIVRTTTKNYNIWVSRLGETDITTGLLIDKQPYVGVLYKSSNQSIWTPDQYEDVKFVLNRAKFTTNTSFTAVLPNKSIPTQKLTKNPFYFTAGSSTIKVFQPNHGMHKTGNKVVFSNVVSDTSNAQLSQTISGTQTTISITDVAGTSGFDAATTEGWNKINNAVVSAQNPGYIKIGDEIILYTGVSGSNLTGCTRGAESTIAVSHAKGSVVQCFQLNGIILSQLNKVHDVTKVIGLDEYEIVVQNNANETKQSGGSEVKSTRNIQFETITPRFNIFSPQGTENSLSITTVSGTSVGNTTQQSFLLRGSEGIDNYVENVMTEPKLILSEPNRTAFQSGQSGTLNTIITMSTISDRVSPVIDLEGSSIITISNRINKELDTNGDLDTSSELLPNGGKHSAYITKKVVLETSSTSIKVLFEAIRTSENDIKVFAKIRGDSAPGSFDEMNYIEIPAVSYPSSETKKQYKAFDFEIKSLREFQEFSVKIVMIGNDQSDVPKIRNLRALALAL